MPQCWLSKETAQAMAFSRVKPADQNKDKYRREGKCRLCCWGDKCTWMPHWPFSSKDDLKLSFWENIHFGRLVVWFGVNRLIKASFLPSSRNSIHPFLQIILVQNSYCIAARNWINSVSQAAATTFAFSSVIILLLCCGKTSMIIHQWTKTWRTVFRSRSNPT